MAALNLFSLVAGAVLQLALPSASAQDYPVKAITMVVASSPGVTVDAVARIMAPEMSKILGQPVVVENKPGANALIGYEYVARQAPPDGYTVLTVTVPSLAILPAVVRDLRFDPLTDLPPLIGLVEGRLVLGSSSKLPWKTFNEMVAQAKTNPGKLNTGAPSPNGRLQTEGLVRELGLNIVYVPYAASSAYLNALLSGEIQMGIVSEGYLSSWGDKFRALAITGEQRSASLPGIPTFAELGLPQIKSSAYSLNVRRGVPKGAFDKLNAAASAALKQQEVKERFAKIQLEVSEQTPEAAAGRLPEEARFFSEIAKKIGLQAQ